MVNYGSSSLYSWENYNLHSVSNTIGEMHTFKIILLLSAVYSGSLQSPHYVSGPNQPVSGAFFLRVPGPGAGDIILPNQTYKTKPTGPNLPNQTKISKGTKAKHQNKIHEQNWQIQTLIKARQV